MTTSMFADLTPSQANALTEFFRIEGFSRLQQRIENATLNYQYAQDDTFILDPNFDGCNSIASLGEDTADVHLETIKRGSWVGSAEYNTYKNHWQVSIAAEPYYNEDEAECDLRVVGHYPDKQQAINALWEARHNASGYPQ